MVQYKATDVAVLEAIPTTDSTKKLLVVDLVCENEHGHKLQTASGPLLLVHDGLAEFVYDAENVAGFVEEEHQEKVESAVRRHPRYEISNPEELCGWVS